MNKEETIQRLNQVTAMKLPKMDFQKLKEYGYKPSDFEETEENIRAMDEYLGKFLDPRNDQIGNGCWLCGNKHVSISWGLAHGVAYSSCCGLSYVKYHYPDDVTKEKKLFKNQITISLQYHPDGFYLDEESEDN